MNKYLKSHITAAAFCAGVLLAVSCSTSREPRTMRLFMQSGRPNIFLPHEESAPSGVLAEQVGFTTSSDTLPGEFEEVSDSTDDVWKTIHLGGVDIVAARTVVKQVTMREGSVRLEFNIHVPSLLIDSCWRVTLTPMLCTSDSSGFPLPPVVLSGSSFTRMQEADYKAYRLFLNGIVDPSAYDSVYLDRKASIRISPAGRGSSMNFTARSATVSLPTRSGNALPLNARISGTRVRRPTVRHSVTAWNASGSKKAYGAMWLVVTRSGCGPPMTVNIIVRPPFGRCTGWNASLPPIVYLRNSVTFITGGRSLSNIHNYVLTATDSMDISRHRYFYDRIAENEMNDRNRDEIRRRMIPFPYIDSVMVRQNSDSVSGHDYIYNYVYSLPVTDGMKKLRVRLESIVEATDRSTWRPAASDTLLFIVASLSDLVDRSALDQYVIASAETDSLAASGPVYTPQGEEYAEALRLLSERQYRQALPILEKRPDYNTALCLTQLGYHKEASALLDQLPVDSRKEYLHAVVSARQGDDYLAVEHMLAACRMNPNLVLRIPLDPELSDLIPKFFGLRMELDRIAEGK